jgi:broad specificity phosphatase PhoE
MSKTPSAHDRPLSDLGIHQARQLGHELNLDGVELVVVSPLTRALQTMHYAVLPKLSDSIPILAHPDATERVYTTSDTGRKVGKLQSEFPIVSFDLLESRDIWWYHTDTPGPEWRPCDAQQFYAVPGEPQHLFEDRIDRLQDWLFQRPERRLCLVSHWAVLRSFTGCEFGNCEARLVKWTRRAYQ